MSYRIIWSDKSRKDLAGIDPSISARIISKVEDSRENPFLFVKRLKGIALYSLRIGDYRAILDIENKKMVVLVVEVGHRRSIYKGV